MVSSSRPARDRQGWAGRGTGGALRYNTAAAETAVREELGRKAGERESLIFRILQEGGPDLDLERLGDARHL